MTMRHIVMALLLVGVAAVAQSIEVRASSIPVSERQALIDLYHATGGTSWMTNTNWNGAAGTECTWYGVTCDGGGTTVQQLLLGGNHLTGLIPSELGSLTSLQCLALNNNQLTGSIPTWLGSLTKLQYLDLDTNQLTGSIPTQLGSLSNLLNLDLSGNKLSGPIPTQLGSLTNVLDLDLWGNELSGPIPTQLGNLTKLQELSLFSNQLTGSIPITLENLTDLTAGDSDLRYNALYSTDSTLTTFLNGKQRGGDWQSTQTVAPTAVAAGATTSTSVTLSWTPITYTYYTDYTGGYQTYYSTTPGGPYTAGGITANKRASSIVVSGLNPGTLYYFVVRTVTNPNAYNLNTVTSDPSAEVHAKTGPFVPGLRRHLQRAH